MLGAPPRAARAAPRSTPSRSRTSARRPCSGTARTGRPVAPAIVWQDRRTADRCRELDAELIRERTGLVPDPYFSATKLEWLLREHGPRRARLRDDRQLARLAADRRRAPRHRHDERLADDALLARRRSTGTTSCSRCSASTARCCREIVALRPTRSAKASCSARPSPSAGIAGDQQAALFGQGCHAPGEARRRTGPAASCSSTRATKCPPPPHGLLATAAARRLRARRRGARRGRRTPVAARRARRDRTPPRARRSRAASTGYGRRRLRSGARPGSARPGGTPVRAG